MAQFSRGGPIRGEFSSADASALSEANQRFSLYAEGSTTALTLGTTDIVHITDAIITAGAALTVTLFDGATNTAGAGKYFAKVAVPANQSVVIGGLTTPTGQGVPGSYLKCLTNGAGQVDVFVRGTLEKPS